MDSRQLRTTALGFLLAGVVLAVLGWLVGVDEVVAILRQADNRGVGLVGLLICGWVAAWGFGIRDVLRALDTPTSSVTGILLSAGAGFANNVTPFGHAGGEPLTGLLIVDRTSAPYERGIAAMATVDTVNVFPSVGFGLVGLGWIAVDSSLSHQLTIVAVAAVVATVVGSLLGVAGWRRRSGLAARLAAGLSHIARPIGSVMPRLTPPSRAKLTARIEGFVADLELIAGSRRTLTVVFGYSAVGWLCQIAALWAAFEAIGAPISFAAALVVVPIGSVAAALPLPGGAGGIEGLLVGLLVATPLSTLPAASVVAGVVLFRGVAFWLPTATGGIVFAESAVRQRRQRDS
ncbi:hypothetical protein halTADL_0986 [Halohasta litchfieldiae]|jgi:hypothetical protein|uniref:Lysylphosphatidylglycerol synthase TM region n=1 Tax=Halohasta litchfieldiae TaxID=1073996 RepID=A0A1H6WD02_9EURY|nr:lysylphosphatidylglycerol synthase transmembrane domain-containing protein [Halohasta litchfieldiae]ATW87781.1 hypothetical protein halTADL_0986 [Halohasta litchfieldiae]SEJ14753.1 hypothetical protein SAMN05444271_1255 [Halohasta litchfieldiae]